MKHINILKSIFRKDYVFQSILIFLSVSLGIMAGNWNEDLKERRKTKVFLKNLVEELKTHKSLLEKRIPYHEKMQHTADSLFEVFDKADSVITFFTFGGMKNVPNWRGLGLVGLSHAVYESGVVSGVFEQIPIDLLSKISRMHLFEEEYTRFSHKLSERLLNLGVDTKMNDMVVLMSILGYDVYEMENSMIRAYNSVIPEIEKHI